jgi:glycosyltransferase involved in cell wall biosynthesis
MINDFSVVIPAKNEAESLISLLPELRAQFPDAEIIVVNDGSNDDTEAVCVGHGVSVFSHPYSMGNGAAIKTGARNASGQIVVFMDADGQHKPSDIPRLLEGIEQGYEMVVGARQVDTHASLTRRLGNSFYNRLASVMTGHQIKDLTSGFRAVRNRHFLKFLYLLPNGFSYPTTSTMAFFRSGLPVNYVPIRAEQRIGKSNISLIRDGLRFFIIILKIGALFSPMRFFLPISLSLFTVGIGYYAYTFIVWSRLTNMTAILLLSSLLTFLIGILSEQVSALHYKHAGDDLRRTRRGDNKTDGSNPAQNNVTTQD